MTETAPGAAVSIAALVGSCRGGIRIGAIAAVAACLTLAACGSPKSAPKSTPFPTLPKSNAQTPVTTTTAPLPLATPAWLIANGATLTALVNDFNNIEYEQPTGNQYGPTLVTKNCQKAFAAGTKLESAPIADPTLQAQLSTALTTYVTAAQKCAVDPDPLDTFGKSTETQSNLQVLAQGAPALNAVEQAIEAAAPGVSVPAPVITTTTAPPPVFSVTGTGPANIVVDQGGQETSYNDISLPWSSNGPVPGYFGIEDIDAQTQSGSSSATISCSIEGSTPNTSTGPYAVVNCVS